MSLRGKHILIIEDNVLNRVVYQITLGVEGANLVFDRKGRDALVQLQMSLDWDLIILDLMLYGGISGFDLFKDIRALPTYSHVPIVAVSASDPSTAIPKARELGFSGFISKPINEALICSQLEAIIAGEHIWHDGTLVDT